MKKIIFLIFAFVLLISCDENSELESNLVNAESVDIYVTGQYNNIPCYWKNNELVLLDNTGISYGIAQKIMISGSDVYVFGQGTGYLNTLYWKNGVLINLNSLLNPSNEPFFQVNDMFIDGSDVYFCGNIGNYTTREICYWKNGVKTTINSNDNGSAYLMLVSNSDLYFSVQNNLGRGYYKNGVFTNETDYCAIYGFSKIDSDVYLYGIKDNSLTGSNYQGYYKNLTTGNSTYLSNTEDVRNLNGDNNNLYFNNSSDIFTNNNPSTFFYSGVTSIIDFKILNDNSYVLSLDDTSSVNFYLDINNTNSMQINGNNGRFTSILVI